MKTLTLLKTGVAPLALGLTLLASPALAQADSTAQPQVADEPAAPTGEIIVTGSRFQNPNITSISPVTVVNALEVKNQGNVRVEDLLNSLPQVFANEGATDANGASGIATVDLRDLGSSRTLVLINGRRLGAGDPTDIAADLNFIPGSLIQRVDVLTGGASATYGSDALAGVVNFILNTKFEGVRLDAQYSLYNHNNDFEDDANYTGALAARGYVPPKGYTNGGAAKNVNLTIGAGSSDGRGHVTAYAGWRKVNAITQGNRDFSYCAYTASSGGSCGGSSTSVTGRFRRTRNVGLGATPVFAPTGPSLTLDPSAPGTFRTYSSPRDGFNFNPYNYFIRPDERYTLGGFASYEINDSFKPYLEVMFMDDHTRAQIAPSGAFFGTDFFLNCNNALASAAQLTALCGANAGTSAIQSVYIGRRNVEGAGRVDDLRHTDYRVVAGMKGDVTDAISYDVYGQFYRAILAERYENDFSKRRINNSLNVVLDSNGRPACAAAVRNTQGLITDPNCVPYNIFATGGVTQAAVNYLATPGLRSGQSDEYIASGTVTVDMGKYGVKSPFASEGVQVALGAEYRKEHVALSNDLEFLTGDLAGQGAPFGVRDVDGQFNVKEFFGEIAIPIVNDRPGFYSMSFNGGYRYSDYSLTGRTDAYKLGFDYAPIQQVRFRAGYNRAVRAPNNLELFTSPNIGLFSGRDTCAGAVPTSSAAQCALTGVTAAQYGTIDANPANQYNQRTSGNSNLTPEISDTYTVGVVVNPIRNLTMTVDGFDIRVNKLIGTLGANYSLTQCITLGQQCGNIQRAPGGSLFTGNGFVDNPTLNLGSVKTRGIDLTAVYSTEVFGGGLSFDLVGTYLDKYTTVRIPGGTANQCAGKFGQDCGTPLPRYRGKLRVSYQLESGLGFSAAWRYFHRVTNDAGVANVPAAVAKIPSQSYFDLSMSAKVGDNYTFRVGAQNILDRSPPFLDGNYSNNGSNTYAQVYDSLGRYLFAAIQLDF